MPVAARLVLLLLLAGWPLTVSAQSGTRRDAVQLERQLQNPITDLMIFQVFNTVEQGVGPEEENQLITNAQALLPIRLSDDWNLLSWTQVLLLSTPPERPGEERVNGLGDTTQYLLIEPARVRYLLWGVGIIGLIPTATNTALGTGQFGFGPAGLLSFQGESLTVSLLAHHLQSVDGAVGRPEVQRTFLKPLISYTFKPGIAVGVESETTVDWNLAPEDRWRVPLQASFSSVTLVGPVPLNLQFGVRWYPVTPPGGPNWGLRVAISFVVSIDREGEARDDGRPGERPAPAAG